MCVSLRSSLMIQYNGSTLLNAQLYSATKTKE